MKCVYAYNSGAALNGFTLTGSGYGGVQCNSGAVVTNCIIRGNTNGVSGGTIFNCLIAQNYTAGEGAGARNATLYNCILSNNVAGGMAVARMLAPFTTAGSWPIAVAMEGARPEGRC